MFNNNFKINYLFFISAIFIYIFLTMKSFAFVPTDSVISKCEITPQIKDISSIPSKFNTTNNLRTATGSFKSLKGQNIILFGRIMDKNCIPISDAKISIWQTNHNGEAKKKKRNSSNYISSGMVNSNNLGQFNFISITPGQINHITPHINVKVTFADTEEFYTKIYFNDHSPIITDPDLGNLSRNNHSKLLAMSNETDNLDEELELLKKHNLEGNKIYIFDLVVNKAIKNKSY